MSGRNYKPVIGGALALVAAGFIGGLWVGARDPALPPSHPAAGSERAAESQQARRRRALAEQYAGPALSPVAELPPTAPVPAQPAAQPAPQAEQDPIARYKEEHGFRGPWAIDKGLFDRTMAVYKTLREEDRKPYDDALRTTGYSASGLDLSAEQESALFDQLLAVNKDAALTLDQRNERSFAAYDSLGLDSEKQKTLALYKERLFPVHDLQRRVRENAEKHEKGEQPR